jgi:hypothetical protein
LHIGNAFVFGHIEGATVFVVAQPDGELPPVQFAFKFGDVHGAYSVMVMFIVKPLQQPAEELKLLQTMLTESGLQEQGPGGGSIMQATASGIPSQGVHRTEPP